MSRISLPGKDNRRVVIGVDHACGMFFQLYPSNTELKQLEKKWGNIHPDNGEELKQALREGCPLWFLNDSPIIDIDENFSQKSASEIIEEATKYTFPSEALNQILKDLLNYGTLYLGS